MFDLGIHETDLVRYLLDDEIVEVPAFGGTLDKKTSDGELIGVDDNAVANLFQLNGVIGIQTFVNQQCRAGYAASSIKRQMAVLKSAFREAQNRQYILKNPADQIILPRMEQKEIDALSAEEVKLLLPHLPKSTNGHALRFIAGTELRVGELCVLRWEDVEANAVHIKQTTTILTLGGKTQRITNPPKTKTASAKSP